MCTWTCLLIYFYPGCPGCGIGSTSSHINCTHHCGYIASPKYPSVYPANTKVTWVIKVTQDNYIQLEFVEFNVESSLESCDQDFVEVYNLLKGGSQTLKGRYCSASPPPPKLLSGTNEMMVLLSSDMEHSQSGFFGHYTSEQYSLPQYIRDDIAYIGKLCDSILHITNLLITGTTHNIHNTPITSYEIVIPQ